MDRTNREVMVKYLNEQIIRQMIEQYSLTVNQSLNRWEGVQRSLKFKKGKPMAIESYFKTAKNWFDQHKIEFLSEMCWTPLFKALHQVITNLSHSQSEGQFLRDNLRDNLSRNQIIFAFTFSVRAQTPPSVRDSKFRKFLSFCKLKINPIFTMRTFSLH